MELPSIQTEDLQTKLAHPVRVTKNGQSVMRRAIRLLIYSEVSDYTDASLLETITRGFREISGNFLTES